MTVGRKKLIPWRPFDVETLVSMAMSGQHWRAISAVLKRSPESCQMKWYAVASDEQKQARQQAIDAQRVATAKERPKAPRRDSRDADVVARQVPVRPVETAPRSLTALVLGDPLPGRSALDQRRPER